MDSREKAFIDYSAKLWVDDKYSSKDKKTVLDDLLNELDKNPEEIKKWVSSQPKLEDYLYEENEAKRLDIHLLEPIIETPDYKIYRNKLELRTDKVSSDWVEQFNIDWNSRLMIRNYFGNETIELDKKPVLMPVSIKQVSNDSVFVDVFASEGYVNKYGNEFVFYEKVGIKVPPGESDTYYNYAKKTFKLNFNKTKNSYLAEFRVPILNGLSRDDYDNTFDGGIIADPYKFENGLMITLTDPTVTEEVLFPNKTVSSQKIKFNSSEHAISDFKLVALDSSKVNIEIAIENGIKKTIRTTTPKGTFKVVYTRPWPKEVPFEKSWYIYTDNPDDYKLEWFKYKP